MMRRFASARCVVAAAASAMPRQAPRTVAPGPYTGTAVVAARRAIHATPSWRCAAAGGAAPEEASAPKAPLSNEARAPQAKLKTHTVPAFATKFEDSATYKAFLLPSVEVLLDELRTAEQRAALPKAELSQKLTVLASRLMSLAVTIDKPDEHEQLLKDLPADLKTAGDVLQLAAEADPTNYLAQLAMCQVKGDAASAVMLSQQEYAKDPTNAVALLNCFNGPAFDIDAAVFLGTEMELNGVTKTGAQWLATLIELDEFCTEHWDVAAKAVGHRALHEYQAAQLAFDKDAERRLQEAPADKVEQLRAQLSEEFRTQFETSTPPSVTINGVPFTTAMCRARCYEIALHELAVFGHYAVPGTRFQPGNLRHQARLQAVVGAMHGLSETLQWYERVEVTIVDKGPNGGVVPRPAMLPVTQLSATEESLLRMPGYAPMWSKLALASLARNLTTVTIGDHTLTPLECAAKACEMEPTVPELWNAVLMVLSELVGREGVEQLPLDKHGQPLVKVGEHDVPAPVINYLRQNPPATKLLFPQLVKEVTADYDAQMQEDAAEPAQQAAADAAAEAPAAETKPKSE